MYICDIDVKERFETGELLLTLNIGALKVHMRLDQATQLHLLHALFGSRPQRQAHIPTEIFCPPLPTRKKTYLQLTEETLAMRKMEIPAKAEGRE